MDVWWTITGLACLVIVHRMSAERSPESTGVQWTMWGTVKYRQKPAVNTIRVVAYLIDELNKIQINQVFKDTINSQINKATTDILSLIKDTREKINDHLKQASPKPTTPSTQTVHLQTSPPINTYASALISPPSLTNPKLAAKEGIKAR